MGHSSFRRYGRWLAAGVAFLVAVSAWSIATPQIEEIAARGHLIAVGGGPGGVSAACFSCHGLSGQGDAGAAFPRLAGLDAHYLTAQMEAYAEGTRPSRVMGRIARELDPADRAAVSVYYSQLPAEGALVPAAAAPDGRLIQHGAVLYAQGSAERGIQACANCHGPNGSGLNRIYPAIAGQPASYIDAQLRLWREGRRENDLHDVMPTIAGNMTDEDIQAVSAYLARLEP